MVSTCSLYVFAICAILAAKERVARSGIDSGVDALHDGLPRSLDAGVWQVGVLTVGEKDDHQLLVGIDKEFRPREAAVTETTGSSAVTRQRALWSPC
jgi:hypothetical protein